LILTVSVVVGETSAHAREMARFNDLLLLWLRSAEFGRYPTQEEANAYH